MFRRSKSKVLVDSASEEDDMSWHYHHSYKDKDIEGEEEEEEAVTAVSKEAKVKNIMSKKERKEKKMSSKDDEHFLLTGVTPADQRGSHKKVKDDDKDKKEKPDKGHCFWESVTMTLRQISSVKKLEKTDDWETPRPHRDSSQTHGAPKGVVKEDQTRKEDLTEPFSDCSDLPLELGQTAWSGLEEDSSHYANLSDSKDPTCAVRWTARAKVKLAGISRMSRGMASESTWEGLK
ncbi:testis development-related protein [Nerophis ophidion]|uniref:testis development-related protein n=1 Tax=Nerophis ophidion TaxID=159077 RepID=UPI002ADF066B|nr:testis development-related protein [Nerophis ophidion]